jgi:nucleotide-binding universal stress UspA family protein
MAIKDILVHIDERECSAARLALAIRLAQEHNAHLAGIFVEHYSFFPFGVSTTADAPLAARELFEAATAAAGLSTEWIHIPATSGLGMAEAVIIHAYYRDLLIIGQLDYDDRCSVPPDFPDRVILGCGRPVLVVPYVGDFAVIGRRIMVAWRSGPESARSISDALPLLLRAEEVAAVSAPSGRGDDHLQPLSGNLTEHLQRHGINAHGDALFRDHISVGDQILNYASDHGADLIVLGVYSQSRRGGQLSLGDVSRHLLRCMTVPTLMSH